MSVKTNTTAKPANPHPDLPLYAHPGKVRAMKILGKVWYFGLWNDPREALETYLTWKDTILAGRDPRKLAGLRPMTNNPYEPPEQMDAAKGAEESRDPKRIVSWSLFTRRIPPLWLAFYSAIAFVVVFRLLACLGVS